MQFSTIVMAVFTALTATALPHEPEHHGGEVFGHNNHFGKPSWEQHGKPSWEHGGKPGWEQHGKPSFEHHPPSYPPPPAYPHPTQSVAHHPWTRTQSIDHYPWQRAKPTAHPGVLMA